MRLNTTVLFFITSFYLTVPALATPDVSVAVNPSNTIPNVVANSIFADGDGSDWTGAALFIELDQGGVYNATQFDLSTAPTSTILNLVPDLAFDSWVGITNDGSNIIAGTAGDFGPSALLQPIGVEGQGHQAVSLAWSNVSFDNLGTNRIGNISLTDDATGQWAIAATFNGGAKVVYLSNPVVNGEMRWNPLQGDLIFDGFVGIDDLSTVLAGWNQNVTPGERALGDPSGDGFVGIEDLGIVLGNWNTGLTPPPTIEPGLIERDYNGDGYVGIDDQNIVMTYWNQNVSPGDQTKGDSDGDGFIGISDMAYRNWNAGTLPQPTGGYTPPILIPEPTTTAVIVLMCVTLLSRRA